MMEYYPTLLEAGVEFRVVSRILLAEYNSKPLLIYLPYDNIETISSCYLIVIHYIMVNRFLKKNTLKFLYHSLTSLIFI